MVLPMRNLRLSGRCGHRRLQKTCVFSVGGRCPHRPVGYVDRAVRKNGHTHTASHGPMWASAPTKNVRFQRRGRCPHRPVGYVDRAVRENGHTHTASHGPMWASAPTKKQCTFPQKTCILTVGGDALIAPWGTLTERSGKTDTPVPPATGRYGHRPLQKTMCVPAKNNVHSHCRVRCLIAPWGALNERSHETNKSFPQGTLTERSIRIYRLLKCKRSSRTFCNRSGLGSGYLPLQQRP